MCSVVFLPQPADENMPHSHLNSAVIHCHQSNKSPDDVLITSCLTETQVPFVWAHCSNKAIKGYVMMC